MGCKLRELKLQMAGCCPQFGGRLGWVEIAHGLALPLPP